MRQRATLCRISGKSSEHGPEGSRREKEEEEEEEEDVGKKEREREWRRKHKNKSKIKYRKWNCHHCYHLHPLEYLFHIDYHYYCSFFCRFLVFFLSFSFYVLSLSLSLSLYSSIPFWYVSIWYRFPVDIVAVDANLTDVSGSFQGTFRALLERFWSSFPLLFMLFSFFFVELLTPPSLSPYAAILSESLSRFHSTLSVFLPPFLSFFHSFIHCPSLSFSLSRLCFIFLLMILGRFRVIRQHWRLTPRRFHQTGFRGVWLVILAAFPHPPPPPPTPSLSSLCACVCVCVCVYGAEAKSRAVVRCPIRSYRRLCCRHFLFPEDANDSLGDLVRSWRAVSG